MVGSVRQLPEDHPSTKLLQKLISDAAAQLAAREKAQLLSHIADAPFPDERRALSVWNRTGPKLEGSAHPSRPGETLAAETELTSAEWHAVKHTAYGEWPTGTTTQEYLSDIRAAILEPGATLHVGTATVPMPGCRTSRLSSRAGVRTRLDGASSAVARVCRKPGHALLAVYDVARRKICSGYRLANDEAIASLQKWANHRAFP